MATISAETIIAFFALLSGGIGVYIKHSNQLEIVKSECRQLKEQLNEIKKEHKEKGEWIEKKMDLFMDRFELMNEKINEFIHEFSKTQK
jgi:uncharacterized coiled-coil protein SlyX